MDQLRWVLLFVVGIFVVWGILRFLVVQVSPPPPTLGVQNGQLAPCPSTANCVSTLFPDDPQHGVAPLSYETDTAVAQATILKIIQQLPRHTLVTNRPDYLHITFRSPGMGFIDDLELYFPPDRNQIEIRAAARLGGRDFDVNRHRVEAIQEQFQQSTP